MTTSLLKTISNEVNLYILGLTSDDRLNHLMSYIKKNPLILLQKNELIS